MYLNMKNQLILLMWCQELLKDEVFPWIEDCFQLLFDIVIALLIIFFIIPNFYLFRYHIQLMIGL